MQLVIFLVLSLVLLMFTIPIMYAVVNHPKEWVRLYGIFGWAGLMIFASLGIIHLSQSLA